MLKLKTESKQKFEELLISIRSQKSEIFQDETNYKNDLIGFTWNHYWGKPALQRQLRGPFDGVSLMVHFSDSCVPFDKVFPSHFLPPNMRAPQSCNLDIHSDALFLQ